MKQSSVPYHFPNSIITFTCLPHVGVLLKYALHSCVCCRALEVDSPDHIHSADQLRTLNEVAARVMPLQGVGKVDK